MIETIYFIDKKQDKKASVYRVDPFARTGFCIIRKTFISRLMPENDLKPSEAIKKIVDVIQMLDDYEVYYNPEEVIDIKLKLEEEGFEFE